MYTTSKTVMELAKLYGIPISDSEHHTHESDDGTVTIIDEGNISIIFGDIFPEKYI